MNDGLGLTLAFSKDAVQGGLEVKLTDPDFNDLDNVQLFEITLEGLSKKPQKIILDLREVKFISSFFVSSLIGLIGKVKKMGHQIVIKTNQDIEETLRMNNVDSMVELI